MIRVSLELISKVLFSEIYYFVSYTPSRKNVVVLDLDSLLILRQYNK